MAKITNEQIALVYTLGLAVYKKQISLSMAKQRVAEEYPALNRSTAGIMLNNISHLMRDKSAHWTFNARECLTMLELISDEDLPTLKVGMLDFFDVYERARDVKVVQNRKIVNSYTR